MRLKTLTLFVGILISTTFAQQSSTDRFSAVINRLMDAMNKKDYSAIVAEFNADMLDALPLDRTTIFFQNLESQYGKVVRVGAPQLVGTSQANIVMYFERGVQDVKLYLDAQGKIAGFLFSVHEETEPTPTPATTTPPVPVVTDKQQTPLLLPFKGSWLISSGGERRDEIFERNLLTQQYAYEFNALDENGMRYRGDGKNNTDFYAFGKEIIAPAGGTVVGVIDGIPDNPPGVRNPYALIGNAVIIQHNAKEFSVLAFLKQGSTKVKVGDKVTAGQVIALCGNSGGSTEPALHFHLQNSASIPGAQGVKFYFERATVTRESKKETKLLYLPTMGDIVSGE